MKDKLRQTKAEKNNHKQIFPIKILTGNPQAEIKGH